MLVFDDDLKKYQPSQYTSFFSSDVSAMDLADKTRELLLEYEPLVKESMKFGKKLVVLENKAKQVVASGGSTVSILRRLGNMVRLSNLTIHLPLENHKFLEVYANELAFGMRVICFDKDNNISVETLVPIFCMNKRFYSLDNREFERIKKRMEAFEKEQKELEYWQNEYYHYVTKKEVRKKLFPQTLKYNKLIHKVYKAPKRINMKYVADEFERKYSFIKEY